MPNEVTKKSFEELKTRPWIWKRLFFRDIATASDAGKSNRDIAENLIPPYVLIVQCLIKHSLLEFFMHRVMFES